MNKKACLRLEISSSIESIIPTVGLAMLLVFTLVTTPILQTSLVSIMEEIEFNAELPVEGDRESRETLTELEEVEETKSPDGGWATFDKGLLGSCHILSVHLGPNLKPVTPPPRV